MASDSARNGHGAASSSSHSGESSLKRGRSSLSPSLNTDAVEKRHRTSSLAPLTIAVREPASYTRTPRQGGIQKPAQVASFSFDEKRELHHDDRSRRYYHAPPPRADLNRGFEERIERDESINEHLDALLSSLQRADSADVLKQAHVITWRGMMTRLCTALYEEQQGFEMNAMMLGDTLYIEEHIGADKKQDRARQALDARLKKFGYYGYSFESYTCHAKRDLDVRNDDSWDGNVNTNVQWCSVVKTKLGPDMRLVIGGEVDAVDPGKLTPVEVKTSMNIRNARDEERFERKMLRFYMQSFLLGVERVVVGFRDPRGMLVTHQPFDTLSMPRAVRGKPHAWDPTACLNFAYDALTAIRKHIRQAMLFDPHSPPPELGNEGQPYPVFRIALHMPRAGSPLSQKSVSITQVEDAVADAQRVGFLPRDYYDYALKSMATQRERAYLY